MIAGVLAHARLADDAAVEDRADQGGVRHRVAGPHQAARVQRRHAGAQARAGRAAVEPSGRDHDRVARDGADAPPGRCDLHDRDVADGRVLGMRARQLRARSHADALAHERELARLARLDREAQRRRVGDRVEHAAVGDVHAERAQALDLERGIDALGVAGHVRELDRLAAPVAAGRARLDDAAGRLQPHDRLGLVHRQHARLEQHGRRADRVGARHRRVLGRLHDDEAGVAIVARRRHDQVRVRGHAAARLAQKQPAQRVAVALERLHLLEHRRSRRWQHAADDDVADLAARVGADDRDCAHGPHGDGCSRWVRQASPASASSAPIISSASAATPRSAYSKMRAPG